MIICWLGTLILARNAQILEEPYEMGREEEFIFFSYISDMNLYTEFQVNLRSLVKTLCPSVLISNGMTHYHETFYILLIAR